MFKNKIKKKNYNYFFPRITFCLSFIYCFAFCSGSGKVVNLTAENFEEYVNENNYTLVKVFYGRGADNEALDEIWNRLAEAFKSENNVVIAKMNLGEYQLGMGEPTIMLFLKGTDSTIYYSGKLDVSSIKSFIRSHTNNSRGIMGQLSKFAGNLSANGNRFAHKMKNFDGDYLKRLKDSMKAIDTKISEYTLANKSDNKKDENQKPKDDKHMDKKDVDDSFDNYKHKDDKYKDNKYTNDKYIDVNDTNDTYTDNKYKYDKHKDGKCSKDTNTEKSENLFAKNANELIKTILIDNKEIFSTILDGSTNKEEKSAKVKMMILNFVIKKCIEKNLKT